MLRIPQSCQDWACDWLDIKSFVAFCAMNTAAWRRYVEGRYATRITVPAIVRSYRTISTSGARLLLHKIRGSRYFATPTYLMIVACTNGAIATAQWISDNSAVGNVRRMSNCLLRQVCERGPLAAVQWMVMRFDLTVDDVRDDDDACLREACARGQLEVAQWLTARFGLTDDDARAHSGAALRAAALGGHLQVVQWLVGHFGLTVEDVRAHRDGVLHAACNQKRSEVVWWLIARFDITVWPDSSLARWVAECDLSPCS
jgi:hypothetical protein